MSVAKRRTGKRTATDPGEGRPKRNKHTEEMTDHSNAKDWLNSLPMEISIMIAKLLEKICTSSELENIILACKRFALLIRCPITFKYNASGGRKIARRLEELRKGGRKVHWIEVEVSIMSWKEKDSNAALKQLADEFNKLKPSELTLRDTRRRPEPKVRGTYPERNCPNLLEYFLQSLPQGCLRYLELVHWQGDWELHRSMGVDIAELQSVEQLIIEQESFDHEQTPQNEWFKFAGRTVVNSCITLKSLRLVGVHLWDLGAVSSKLQKLELQDCFIVGDDFISFEKARDALHTLSIIHCVRMSPRTSFGEEDIFETLKSFPALTDFTIMGYRDQVDDTDRARSLNCMVLLNRECSVKSAAQVMDLVNERRATKGKTAVSYKFARSHSHQGRLVAILTSPEAS